MKFWDSTDMIWKMLDHPQDGVIFICLAVLDKLFHAPQSMRGGAMRFRNASCFILLCFSYINTS